MPVVPVRACYGYGNGCCVGHIVRTKLKQDGGICLARRFRTSVGSGIDAGLRRGNCNFDRVLQVKWGSMETATGVRDCCYGRVTGTGVGMLWVWIQV